MEKKHTPTTFHEWVKQTFTWVDNDLKRYMQRSWAASTKAANKRNKDNVKQLLAEKQELIDALDSVRYELQSENERMRKLLKEIMEGKEWYMNYQEEQDFEYTPEEKAERAKNDDFISQIQTLLNPK